MLNKNKKDNKKSGVNPIVAAVTVGVVGAGIAAAVAFKDKKNRNKAKEMLTNVKDKAAEYVDKIQNRAQDSADEVENKLAKGKKAAKKGLKEVKQEISK